MTILHKVINISVLPDCPRISLTSLMSWIHMKLVRNLVQAYS